MRVDLVILNYNGRRWLAECLPSIVEAARRSRHECDVVVIDNDSRDDSLAWLAERFPAVCVVRRPNRGLCSYNDVLPELPGRVAVLLNNDIKLEPDAIDPLVEPLRDDSFGCFMTAPLCRRFDGRTYEGGRTAVQWRFGLVRATSFFAGHEALIERPGLTASAGAVMAVNRQTFLRLGGFDPLYLPGRLEDLDLAFRAYQAGYHARYVPDSRALHLGMATFAAVFGQDGCDRLALRNTLLFQWKNLREPGNLARQLAGGLARLAADVVRAPATPSGRRWAFCRALAEAIARGASVERPKPGVRAVCRAVCHG
ncbi:MAG: glycosyltransferase, partial [Pirellulales bacterium]|nr:glycosyltransferase [Pirellulales bacterium]